MLKKLKLGLVALLLPLVAFAQSYPSPTFNNLTVQGTFTATGKVTLASLATQAANTVVANVTASSASPTAVALPNCSTANSALQYTSGTGLSCGAAFALTSGTLAQFAATTSAQLAGVISDETGSGSLVFSISPTLTGIPLAPTAAAGTNTTQIATTAFVQGINTGRLLNVQVFTATGTYTPTAGTASVVVYAVGAGGGGGATVATGAGQSAVASGGGGGSFALVRVTSAFSGVTVTIGTAGSGGVAGSNPGGTGGTTSFGTIVSCPGGVGGVQGAALTAGSGNATAGGAAPTIAGATTLFSSPGYPASTIAMVIAAGTVEASGSGANGPFGSGGAATSAGAGASAGNAGGGHGSGGSGAVSGASQSAMAGGNATAGLVVVYEYD